MLSGDLQVYTRGLLPGDTFAEISAPALRHDMELKSLSTLAAETTA